MVAQVIKDGQPDPLLPLFTPGELLTIQRTVNGQNVLMFVEAMDPCSIGARGLTLKARIKRFGVSSYADGRVETQRQSIDRLMLRLNEAEKLLAKANWDDQPLSVQQKAEAWLRNQREGTSGDNKEGNEGAAAPEQLHNPDGSGYQV